MILLLRIFLSKISRFISLLRGKLRWIFIIFREPWSSDRQKSTRSRCSSRITEFHRLWSFNAAHVSTFNSLIGNADLYTYWNFTYAYVKTRAYFAETNYYPELRVEIIIYAFIKYSRRLYLVIYREKQEMTVAEFARLSNKILYLYIFFFKWMIRFIYSSEYPRTISVYRCRRRVIQSTVSSCIYFSFAAVVAQTTFSVGLPERIVSARSPSARVITARVIFSPWTYNELRSLPGAVHRRVVTRQWFLVNVLGRATAQETR